MSVWGGVTALPAWEGPAARRGRRCRRRRTRRRSCGWGRGSRRRRWGRGRARRRAREGVRSAPCCGSGRRSRRRRRSRERIRSSTSSGVGDVPVGVGDDGDAAGVADQLDRLLGGGPAARDEGLGAGHQVLLEEGAEVAGRAGGAGDVGAADRERRRRPRGSRPRACRSKPSRRSFSTISPARLTPLLLRPLAGGRDLLEVDPVAADVQVFGVLVHAGHLDRRHQLDPEPLAASAASADPRDRVVVGQRQRRHPRLRSFGDDLGRRQLPVGDRRMALQLDQHAPQPSWRRVGPLQTFEPGPSAATLRHK